MLLKCGFHLDLKYWFFTSTFIMREGRKVPVLNPSCRENVNENLFGQVDENKYKGQTVVLWESWRNSNLKLRKCYLWLKHFAWNSLYLSNRFWVFVYWGVFPPAKKKKVSVNTAVNSYDTKTISHTILDFIHFCVLQRCWWIWGQGDSSSPFGFTELSKRSPTKS